MVSSAYLRLLIFLPAILIPACASSSPAFLMMYSVYKLNKQGDNIQPWRTPFPIWNQSVVPCPVLTVASWPAYRFIKRHVTWSGIPISFRIFHSLLWSTQSKVNKVDVFLAFSCFFYDPTDVGNLISGSSAFSKTSLNIWKFTAHILLKPSLENFEHYFISVWDECNCAVVWEFFALITEEGFLISSCYSLESLDHKVREFQKTIYLCFIDCASPLTVWIVINCGKLLKR